VVDVDSPATAAPPALTTWESTWRYLFALTFGGLLWVSSLDRLDWEVGAVVIVDLLLGVAGIGLMPWRRRQPLAVALTVNLLGMFSVTASGAVIVITVSVATRRRWREIVPVVVVGLLSSAVFFLTRPDIDDSLGVTMLFSTFFAAAVIATGMYVGARRDLVGTLQERAERAEREQGMRVAQAQATERARIAREMHDVLAHRLSLVAMHAGALSYRRDLTDVEVSEAADVIRSNAHRALTDLREILGVLRAAEATGALDRPQPTLEDLPQLLEETREAGTKVRLRNDIGNLSAAPDTLGRSAYRMVQESLTNARKHAPDTTVDVALCGGPGGELRLEVRNPVRVGAQHSSTPGAGLGLVGLTERAELIGGHLEHATSDGEFVVRAWLPWPA